ncbi:MAG: EamA family transporter [Ignavibacteriaceae bacterium]
MNKAGLKIFLVYALLCFIWGSTWVVIRFGLESLTPMFSAGVRFAAASIFVFILMKIKNISIQTDRIAIRLYLLMGFMSFVAAYGLVYWAEQFISSGMAAVLFAVYPFWIVIFSYVRMPGEHIGFYKIIGTMLGFSGIVVIFSDSFTGDFTEYILGMLAVVLSGTIQAWVAVSVKKSGNHLNPLSMNFISLVAFITPIVALILGYFLYNEELSLRHFIGTALVLTGVFGANLGNLVKLREESIFQLKKEIKVTDE